MKSYIENIKFEIEVLELEWREYVKGTYLTEEEFGKIQVSKTGNKNFRYIKYEN